MLPDVGTRHHGVLLVLAVDDFPHPPHQLTALVGLQQRVPVVAPDDFDHVPAGTAEDPFQFLNDLAVAAHRAIESLQVAVDDEDQVVQLFAGRQRDRAQRFRFVAFAVAQESPDSLVHSCP